MYIFNLYLVQQCKKKTMIQTDQVAALIYVYSSSFHKGYVVFKQGLGVWLMFRKFHTQIYTHKHTHCSSLPCVCRDEQDCTFPNWKWKAWLTLSLSFPDATPFCLEQRGVQGIGRLTYNAEASSFYVTLYPIRHLLWCRVTEMKDLKVPDAPTSLHFFINFRCHQWN